MFSLNFHGKLVFRPHVHQSAINVLLNVYSLFILNNRVPWLSTQNLQIECLGSNPNSVMY